MSSPRCNLAPNIYNPVNCSIASTRPNTHSAISATLDQVPVFDAYMLDDGVC